MTHARSRSDDINMATLSPANNANTISQQPRGQHGMQKSFATEFSPDDENHGVYGALMNTAGSCIGSLGAIPCCVCFPNPYKVREPKENRILTQRTVKPLATILIHVSCSYRLFNLTSPSPRVMSVLSLASANSTRLSVS